MNIAFDPPIKIGDLTIYSVSGALAYLSHYRTEYRLLNDRIQYEVDHRVRKKLLKLKSTSDDTLNLKSRYQYWKDKYYDLRRKYSVRLFKKKSAEINSWEVIEFFEKHPQILEVTPDQYDLFRDRHTITYDYKGKERTLYSLSGEFHDWVLLSIKDKDKNKKD